MWKQMSGWIIEQMNGWIDVWLFVKFSQLLLTIL